MNTKQSRPAQLGDIIQGKFSTAILKCPTGRYTIVGSVPLAVQDVQSADTSDVMGGRSFRDADGNLMTRRTKVWETEGEAVVALIAAGVKRFQLSDCSWYEEVTP